MAPRVLSVFPTYRCNAACRDCGTASSPADRNRLDRATVEHYVSEAARLGFQAVVVTGGEATLEWETCLAAIGRAHDLALTTRLVTNAQWATDAETAHRRLGVLRAAGLDELNISTGDEHVRFVPLRQVALAVRAASALRLPVTVMIEVREKPALNKAVLLEAIDPDLREHLPVIESPWMPMSVSRTARYPNGVAIDEDNLARTSGCDSVLETFVVAADGRIAACCGLGMRTVKELQVGVAPEPLAECVTRASADLLKFWLATWGPHRILAWAAEKDPSIPWRGLYAHKCQACLAIYRDPRVATVIRAYHHEVVPQVLYDSLTEAVATEELSHFGKSSSPPSQQLGSANG